MGKNEPKYPLGDAVKVHRQNPESDDSFFTKSGSSPTFSASSNPPPESRTKTKTAHPQKVRKETPAQRKLREAQELVKAAKKKREEAWRAQWEVQQKDPAYQAKQARLAETREERSRKMAIGKENARLAREAELMKYVRGNGEQTAYHEAGHAVIHEVLGNGIAEATIIPKQDEAVGLSLGHVSPHASHFPIPEYQQNLYAVVGMLAGGMVVHSVYDLEPDEDGAGGDEEKVSQIINLMNLNDAEESQFLCDAWTLGQDLLSDSRIWAAVEEVKEALLTYKTIPGDVARAIVKRQYHPGLFPLTITKQLSFHYRKEFFTSYWETASYSLGIGDYHQGFTLSNPRYVMEFLKSSEVPKAVDVEQPRALPTQLVLDLCPVEVQKAA
jgi:hypothetical protein